MISADITTGAPKRFVVKSSYKRTEPQWDEQFELELCSESEIYFELTEGRMGKVGQGRLLDFVDRMRKEWRNGRKIPDIPSSRQLEQVYYGCGSLLRRSTVE